LWVSWLGNYITSCALPLHSFGFACNSAPNENTSACVNEISAAAKLFGDFFVCFPLGDAPQQLLLLRRQIRLAVARRSSSLPHCFLPVRAKDKGKPPPGRGGDGFFLARDLRNKPLPRRPNAIDATICVATGVMTDRSARHWTRAEHDACPGNAMGGITDVFAIHDRLGWLWIESETCKPQQDASSNPGCRR
jgi:hypothetical protein